MAYVSLKSGEIECESGDLTLGTASQKTLLLEQAVWEDMRVTPGAFDRPGASDPNIYTYNVNGGGVNTYLYEFDNNIYLHLADLSHRE